MHETPASPIFSYFRIMKCPNEPESLNPNGWVVGGDPTPPFHICSVVVFLVNSFLAQCHSWFGGRPPPQSYGGRPFLSTLPNPEGEWLGGIYNVHHLHFLVEKARMIVQNMHCVA